MNLIIITFLADDPMGNEDYLPPVICEGQQRNHFIFFQWRQEIYSKSVIFNLPPLFRRCSFSTLHGRRMKRQNFQDFQKSVIFIHFSSVVDNTLNSVPIPLSSGWG